MGIELARAFVTVRGDTGRLVGDLGKAKAPVAAKMGTIGTMAGKAFAGAMAIAGVAGFGMMFAMAGREATTFEKTMVDVRANARLLGSEGQEAFGRMEGAARKMGATTMFAATEAAEALNQLALGGLNAGEAIGSLPAVLNLAASANLGLSQAAKIVVDNMRKYGMEATDTGQIADFLSSAQSRAQITAEELASGLQSLGSIAAAMNVSFRDSVAILTGMGRAGTEMNKAGGALAMALARLSMQPKEVKRAMVELGIVMSDFVDDTGSLQIVDLFKKIATSLPTDPIERGAKAMQLFGARGREILGVMNLMAAGDFVKETQIGLIDDAGRAAEVAAAKMDTFWGTLKKIRSALGELIIAGMTPLLKALEPSINMLKHIITLGAKILSFFWPLQTLLKVIVSGAIVIGAIKLAMLAWAAATKAVAAATLFLQSLAGPAAWTHIAAATVAAGVAIVGMNAILEGTATEAREANQALEGMASVNVDGLNSSLDETIDSLEKIYGLTPIKLVPSISEQGGPKAGFKMTGKLDLEEGGFGAETTLRLLADYNELEEGWKTLTEGMVERVFDLRKAFRAFGDEVAMAEGITEFRDRLSELNVPAGLEKVIAQLHGLVDVGERSVEQAKAIYKTYYDESPFGKIAKQIEDVNFEVEALAGGWDAARIELEKFARQEWVSEDRLKEMKKAIELREALKAEKEEEKGFEDLAKKIKEEIQTPVDKMRDFVFDIEDLVGRWRQGLKGGLSPAEATEYLKMEQAKLMEESAKLMEEPARPEGLTGRFGFADYGRALQDMILKSDDPAKKVAKNTEETNKKLDAILTDGIKVIGGPQLALYGGP